MRYTLISDYNFSAVSRLAELSARPRIEMSISLQAEWCWVQIIAVYKAGSQRKSVCFAWPEDRPPFGIVVHYQINLMNFRSILCNRRLLYKLRRQKHNVFGRPCVRLLSVTSILRDAISLYLVEWFIWYLAQIFIIWVRITDSNRFPRSWGQRSRSSSNNHRLLVNSIAREPLTGFEPKLKQVLGDELIRFASWVKG